MAISYKKLWKMLIDKDMKKKDLCNALQCDIGDIMEMVPETADRKDAE